MHENMTAALLGPGLELPSCVDSPMRTDERIGMRLSRDKKLNCKV
jgi:hypothetical protein